MTARTTQTAAGHCGPAQGEERVVVSRMSEIIIMSLKCHIHHSKPMLVARRMVMKTTMEKVPMMPMPIQPRRDY